ncbi:MAG: anion transporter [Burkholderiales bacterium]|nr:anion transporter [Burkholderiales bacterium]MDE2564514.1 anion transporter [Burkholderiales bacterium]
MRAVLRGLRGDHFFLVLLAVLAALALLGPAPVASYPGLVDWSTIAALTGLLALTQGLDSSGALQRLGRWLIRFMATERAAALCLVLAAALLSTVLTNDVALFVVVPLTLGVCRLAGVAATRYVVFEALAVNAGSALTPIGNPQNLFLWQRSGISFGGFVAQMLPLVALMMGALLLLTALAFRGRPLRTPPAAAMPPLDRPLLALALLLYGPFLVAADLHRAGWALAAVLGALLALRPRVLLRLDWGLLLVFVLMFVDLRLLAALPAVQAAIPALGLGQPRHLYLAAIAASQVVSNVPAAIALAEYSRDWRVMAYGVSVGGFGWMVGSLANLIALRLAGDRKAWFVFHLVAGPFLALATAMGWVLLFGLGPFGPFGPG